MTLHKHLSVREQIINTVTPDQVVEKWIDRIATKHEDLGGHSICPFVKNIPKVVSVEKLSLEEFKNIGSEITVYMETSIRSTYQELEEICRTLKAHNPNLVFLPDHPHRPTDIKGHETGNGFFPCIIVQMKQELDSARTVLIKTDYYKNWDPAYLAEIHSFD